MFFPPVMMGQRNVNVFPLYGERKHTGDVAGPLFATNGLQFLVAGIGVDGGATGTSGAGTGFGVVPASGVTQSNATTLSGAVSVGASTVTVASGTGYTIGDYIVIDLNNTATPTTCEIRKIATGTSGTTINLDSPLKYSHLTGATVKSVTAASSPYWKHTIVPSNDLPSLTVEKIIGGYQSLQYVGTKVGKYGLKCQAADSPVEVTSNLIAKQVNIAPVSTPSTVSVVNEAPFVFAEATLTLPGFTPTDPTAVVAQTSNVSLEIDNGLKPTYTLNGSHDLQFLTPVTRHISGQFDLVFTSLNDADWGYFSKMLSQVQSSLTLTFVHPGSSPQQQVSITLNQINLAKYGDALKMDDVIMTTLDFEASYQLGGSAPTGGTVPGDMFATVTNQIYLPY